MWWHGPQSPPALHRGGDGLTGRGARVDGGAHFAIRDSVTDADPHVPGPSPFILLKVAIDATPTGRFLLLPSSFSVQARPDAQLPLPLPPDFPARRLRKRPSGLAPRRRSAAPARRPTPTTRHVADAHVHDGHAADVTAPGDAGGCHATPLAADRARKVVLSHPYDDQGNASKDFEVFDLDAAGKLTEPKVHFSLGTTSEGVIAMTPDGAIGIVAEGIDGTLGVAFCASTRPGRRTSCTRRSCGARTRRASSWTHRGLGSTCSATRPRATAGGSMSSMTIACDGTRLASPDKGPPFAAADLAWRRSSPPSRVGMSVRPGRSAFCGPRWSSTPDSTRISAPLPTPETRGDAGCGGRRAERRRACRDRGRRRRARPSSTARLRSVEASGGGAHPVAERGQRPVGRRPVRRRQRHHPLGHRHGRRPLSAARRRQLRTADPGRQWCHPSPADLDRARGEWWRTCTIQSRWWHHRSTTRCSS